MDKSIFYISTCKAAEEIQNIHVLEEGDYYHDDVKPGTVVLCPPINPVWLPRQDQLQSMIDVKHHFDLFEPDEKIKWMGAQHYLAYNESWEMIWLRYVMAIRFNKEWVDEGKWRLIE